VVPDPAHILGRTLGPASSGQLIETVANTFSVDQTPNLSLLLQPESQAHNLSLKCVCMCLSVCVSVVLN
jgi:hypothetical protein